MWIGKISNIFKYIWRISFVAVLFLDFTLNYKEPRLHFSNILGYHANALRHREGVLPKQTIPGNYKTLIRI